LFQEDQSIARSVAQSVAEVKPKAEKDEPQEDQYERLESLHLLRLEIGCLREVFKEQIEQRAYSEEYGYRQVYCIVHLVHQHKSHLEPEASNAVTFQLAFGHV
jgi:hypothetical protein